MASGQERVLRRRIRSVESTKKITRAMELIAASRIVKAQQRVAAARPYAELLTEALRNLAAAGGTADGGLKSAYEFEPEPEAILARLLPAYVEARLYDAFLEAAASEHAARQRAMKAATDNATELIRTLERIAN